jgi:hypothetical protein
MKKAFLLPSLMLSVWMIALPGCVTLGPKVETRHTYIQNSTTNQRNCELAICLQDVTVETEFKSDTNGVSIDKLNLKDLALVRPDVAKAQGLIAARVTKNILVRVLMENGKEDTLDVGGWYIKVEKQK